MRILHKIFTTYGPITDFREFGDFHTDPVNINETSDNQMIIDEVHHDANLQNYLPRELISHIMTSIFLLKNLVL